MAAKLIRKCLVMQVLVFFLVVSALASPLKRRRRSLNKIKEINREGPYVGLVTVYPPEETAFIATGAFKPHRTYPFVDLSGLIFLHICLFIVGSV